jgi:hypothetical protein
MKCYKCKGEFNEKAKKYKTYKGIDVHHNPPQFLMDKWEGETYNVYLSGSGLGFALNSGRIAGENAAQYVSGK